MKRIILGIFVVTAILLVSGCMLPGMTPSDRVDSFKSDVQLNRSNIYTNIHPSSSLYNQAKDPTVFDTYFPSNWDYVGDMNISGSTVTVTDNQSTGRTIIFTMQVDSGSTATDDYKIYSITVNGGAFP